ncbi:MAG: Lar family restriction alleviation protein [Sulfitobacter sp.]|uniref:Lar family restriction alleviation protein n=1 Tax=Alphaproteobacteria TaxID=28211 RepID=UPI002941CBE3|nr:Lar family restriction alleviation protein [Sulfitobacter sp. LC.270.F.C4]WOI13535.1 Lar family restriction alleviation protein [Sulfitobacter sp. LC.270.F.C4]
MNNHDLKPCPFCGGDAVTNEGGSSTYGRFWWTVGCVDCDIFMSDPEVWDPHRPGMLDPAYPPQFCFDQWNTRAQEATA